VSLVWWIYPDRRADVVFRDGIRLGEMHDGDELDGGDVLPGFRLTVPEIFAEE